jgi:hypothetical protein
MRRTLSLVVISAVIVFGAAATPSPRDHRPGVHRTPAFVQADQATGTLTASKGDSR